MHRNRFPVTRSQAKPSCSRSSARRTAVAALTACAVLAVTVLATTGLVMTAVLSGPASPARAAKPTVLTVGTDNTVDSLNPFESIYLLPTQIGRLMYDFLTNYDPRTQQPVPGLAASWQPQAGGLVWKYYLRWGAKWSDGQPVTARDVAFTYNLIMHNTTAATANGSLTTNFKSVTAVSNYEVDIALSKPQATMLALDIPIVPEHVYARHGSKLSAFDDTSGFPVVSDGPFILAGYTQGQSITLKANPAYWRGRPKFDEVVFRFYSGTDAEVAALRKGEVDFAFGLNPTQYNSLKNAPHVALNAAPGSSFLSLTMNPGSTTLSGQHFGNANPALANPLVRQAIMYAINKPQLVSKVWSGYAKAGAGYIPPAFPAYQWSPPASMATGYNPQKAQQLLNQAGYKPGPGGMRLTPSGKPFTLRLLGENDIEDEIADAPYIVGWLKAVGIAVTPAIVAGNQLQSEDHAGNYDLVFDTWTVNPNPDLVLAMQTCGTRPNQAGATSQSDDDICDPAYDSLYTTSVSDLNATQHVADVKAMEQRLYTDHYINILYNNDELEAYRTDVVASMEKQPQPDGSYFLQNGYWGLWSATPAASPAGVTAGPIAGGVVTAVVVVAAVAGYFLIRRRRATAAERE
jgi:peptide/nickel transport system substrate-binding protein